MILNVNQKLLSLGPFPEESLQSNSVKPPEWWIVGGVIGPPVKAVAERAKLA
jgi:hypothetical protein